MRLREIRGRSLVDIEFPDCASLHSGYGVLTPLRTRARKPQTCRL